MRSLISAIALLLPMTALAQDRFDAASHWAIGLKAGAVFTDDGLAEDKGVLAGIELIRHLDPKWSLELEATFDQVDLVSGVEREQKVLQFNLVQTNRVPLWDPYFLVGVGAQRFTAGEAEGTDLTAAVAVGGRWDLTPRGLKLRIDARYRYNLLDDAAVESGEPLVTVGLEIPLGR